MSDSPYNLIGVALVTVGSVVLLTDQLVPQWAGSSVGSGLVSGGAGLLLWRGVETLGKLYREILTESSDESE